MNVSSPHELYRTPRLRQAARTLGVSVESVVEKVSRFEREAYFESEVEKKLRE
jgi:DNA-binding transcriptional MocR family regulator